MVALATARTTMITRVSIQNYKSIEKLELSLGRVNVLIGANGCGKSNLLEAIALASAAAQRKLDNEFLSSRGIRVTQPRFMRSAFDDGSESVSKAIEITVDNSAGESVTCRLLADESGSYPKWTDIGSRGLSLGDLRELSQVRLQGPDGKELDVPVDIWPHLVDAFGDRWAQLTEPTAAALFERIARRGHIPDFLIYSPENTSLRAFQDEGQILPLGTKGEGLLAHLQALASKNRVILDRINDRLQLLDWFERLEIPDAQSAAERSLQIRDRHLGKGLLFDQRSANEGFLFLLFYFALFASTDTPPFIAVDNVDASLNPKTCSKLVSELVLLARENEKQAILTTHNPAVLDGLDLNEDDQRLFVVSRNKRGATIVRRIGPPKPLGDDAPVKLSEAFLRGYIGGLPKNF